MYYANSFLTQLSPNKAKKVRYAPPENASQIPERHFLYVRIRTNWDSVHSCVPFDMVHGQPDDFLCLFVHEVPFTFKNGQGAVFV